MKFWFDTFKSRLLLTFITYVVYMLLYIFTDAQAREFYFGGYSVWWYAIDVVTTFVCIFLFVQLSIFYSGVIYRCFMSFGRPYRSLIIYSVMLLVMNNVTAYLLSLLTAFLFNMDGLPFMQVQHLYVYAIMSAFISSIYTNAHYLHSYLDAEAEKKQLELAAMQAQLNALKQQIDPHFMFNNFSILSELILEDRALAVKSENKVTHLHLNDGTTATVPMSMDALESQLNPDEFFRANRQYIIHIDSVEYVGNYFNAKLIVRLKRYPSAEVVVSRDKASAFKAWLDR